MIQFIPYLRVTRPPPPPPVPTICDRIATNNRGSLRFLTMSEIAATKDVSVWEGADSLVQGIHQQYMYEAEEALAFPEVLEDQQAVINTSQPVSPDIGFGFAQLNDLILAFMSATGSIVPRYFLDVNSGLEGIERVRVSDTNQDDFVLQTLDVPSPHGQSEFYAPGVGNTLFIGTGMLIRDGARDVYASSQISGSSIVETITPSEDQSIVVACLSYQGTTASPAISALDESWTVLRTVNQSNAAGTLHGLQVMAVKQVQTAALTTFSCTLDNHDGSNTTSVILAAIKPTGGLDSIWQQWILMKDATGDFTPGEVLSIQ